MDCGINILYQKHVCLTFNSHSSLRSPTRGLLHYSQTDRQEVSSFLPSKSWVMARTCGLWWKINSLIIDTCKLICADMKGWQDFTVRNELRDLFWVKLLHETSRYRSNMICYLEKCHFMEILDARRDLSLHCSYYQ